MFYKLFIYVVRSPDIFYYDGKVYADNLHVYAPYRICIPVLDNAVARLHGMSGYLVYARDSHRTSYYAVYGSLANTGCYGVVLTYKKLLIIHVFY